MGYKLIDIKKYLEKIKKEYIIHPHLWYDSILPKKKADDLKEQLKGDFSLLWHEHCSMCWKTIDSKIKICYYDEVNKDWLCDKCYNKINKNN